MENSSENKIAECRYYVRNDNSFFTIYFEKNKFLPLIFLIILFFTNLYSASESDTTTTYTIAVSNFTLLGDSENQQWIGESCAEGIQNKLVVEKNIRIVERQYLSTIINELKFQESGLVNEKSAVELGKLSGAKYFILGSVSILNKSIVIRARMVDVEMGHIINSDEASGILDNLFQLQTELARKIATKILGHSIIQNSIERSDDISLTQSDRSKFAKLKKISASLPLFSLDPARKRKTAEFTTAGILCDDIIENYPEAIIGYYYKALFSLHAEEYEEADAILRSAKLIDPNNLEMLLLRSMYLFHLQKYQESKALLTYLSSKYPRDARIWFGLAKVSARLNEYSAVIESLINALEQSPYIPQAEPFLQTIITQQQSSSFHFSDPVYWKAVSLFKKIWESGDVIQTNDLSIVASVQNAFPNLYISYYVAGKIQTSLGNKTAAIENYQHCLELMPAYPLIHRELAYLFLENGECSVGKNHAILYLQTSQVVEDYKEIQERIQRCR